MSYYVEVAPTNGPDDADAVMNWVDITAYTNDRLQPVAAGWGRQTELQAVEPGSLALVVNNADHRFTAGNPISPYYPGWREGMRIRVRETIGGRSFTIFDGNMLQPDLIINLPDVDQTVTVIAIDRIGRLQAGRKFVSTLAEHIMYNGGGSLVAYWPLLESGSGPFVPGPTTSQLSLGMYSAVTFGFPLGVASDTSSFAQVGGGSAIPGDDRSTLRFAPQVSATGVFGEFPIIDSDITPVTLTSGNTLSLSMWLYFEDPDTSSNIVVNGIAPTDGFQLQRFGGSWYAQYFLGAATPTIAFPGGRPIVGGWNLITMRMGIPSGLCELWVNRMVNGMTTTIGSPPASSQPISRVYVGGPLQGNVAHLQIYMGTGFTAAAHVAQYQAGLTGLYGQFAGDRIRTVAGYAGMSLADLAVDQGTAVMQKASLAGKSPFQAMQEAADTDQGLLHAVGRRLVFHSRKRRYDL